MNRLPVKILALGTLLFCLLLVSVSTALADAPPSSPTAINLSMSTKSLALGDSLTVTGTVSPTVSGLSPVSGASITLTYTKPDGTTITSTSTSGSDGSFNDTYTPNVTGNWKVSASWPGDVTYLGATSSTEQFTVTDNSLGGVPSVYLYVIIVIIVIAIGAVGVILYKRKK
jgi:hypothetical protein